VLAGDTEFVARDILIDGVARRRQSRRLVAVLFLGLALGFVVGAAALFGTAWITTFGD
jgi:hypothetical protein